jgi:hypothetical protein
MQAVTPTQVAFAYKNKVPVSLGALVGTVSGWDGSNVTLTNNSDGTTFTIAVTSQVIQALVINYAPPPASIGPFTLQVDGKYAGTTAEISPSALLALGQQIVNALTPVVGP